MQSVRGDDLTVSEARKGPENERAKRRFEEDYKLLEKLGSGAFSVVHKCELKRDNTKFAVKIITKAQLSADDLKGLKDEVVILKKMHHKNIIKIYNFYSEDRYYYLVMEYLEGGELFSMLESRKSLSETEASAIIRTILVALDYMHAKGFAHRDLKPENILLSEKHAGIVKIADFGFAKAADAMQTPLGTPGYVAPEIISQNRCGAFYTPKVDIWSLGVITYIILCGYPPFNHKNQNILFKMINAGEFTFPAQEWDSISSEAKDFISKMLVVNSEDRYGASQLLQHQWIVGQLSTRSIISTRTLGDFNAKATFKKAGIAVMAAHRLSSGSGQSVSNEQVDVDISKE